MTTTPTPELRFCPFCGHRSLVTTHTPFPQDHCANQHTYRSGAAIPPLTAMYHRTIMPRVYQFPSAPPTRSVVMRIIDAITVLARRWADASPLTWNSRHNERG